MVERSGSNPIMSSLKEKFQTLVEKAKPSSSDQGKFEPMNTSGDLEGQTISLTDANKDAPKSMTNEVNDPKQQSKMGKAKDAVSSSFTSAKEFVLGRKEPEP